MRLVNDLLTLTRADSGHLTIAREPVPLHALLRRVVAEYQLQAAVRGIALTCTCPEALVLGDSAWLHQLFANLCDNALRYTATPGQVTVVGHLQPGQISICVTDTGMGIAPEHLSHLFERFYRVDKERTRTEGGTGLGLAICQEIVQAHGGVIHMDSTIGGGSCCTVALPLCVVEWS